MSRYNYCDTTDRIYFKKDAKKAKELIISEDACDRLNDLERQLAEAMNKLNKIESVCNGYKAMQSEYETGTEIPYWDIMNIIKEQLKEKGDETR